MSKPQLFGRPHSFGYRSGDKSPETHFSADARRAFGTNIRSLCRRARLPRSASWVITRRISGDLSVLSSVRGHVVWVDACSATSRHFRERISIRCGRRSRIRRFKSWVSTADCCEMFPNYGMEMSSMFYFWEKFGEAAWSGVDVLTAEELGISQELMNVRSSLQEVDWSSVIGT
jgi:hypothetical protein